MFSIGRIGAGAGCTYLTGQVASGDTPRVDESLLDYYERSGYPAGEWVGSAAVVLGLAGRVEETDMEALFGRCVDPRDGAQLGRRLPTYRSVEERVAERLAALGDAVDEVAREAIAAEEVAKGTPQAVTGFDLTFSAPKSVSVLFALGDRETREVIREAHETAWREAFAHFEREVAATRLGAGGVAQVEVRGVTAASFEHFASRAGDPQLHTHVATSVMVQTRDGRWRRLDSRALYRASATLRERYTDRLFAELARRLGAGMTHRRSGRSEHLVPEVAGVPEDLLRAFSARAEAINEALAHLSADYHARHGYAPDAPTTTRLAQQATLATRKPPASRSLAAASEAWRSRAAGVLGIPEDRLGAHLARLVREARGARPRVAPEEALPALAASVLTHLEGRAATWSGNDQAAAVARVLREAGWRSDPGELARLGAVVAALPELVAIGPPPDTVPEALRRSDGSSVFTRRGEERFSSTRILAAEERLVSLAGSRRPDPRREGSPFAGLDDEELSRLASRTEAHLAELDAEVARLRAEPDVAVPAPGRVAEGVSEAFAAAERLAARIGELDARLDARGLARPRGRTREALLAERARLLATSPLVGLSAPERARLLRERLARAEAADGRIEAERGRLGRERAARAARLVALEAEAARRAESLAALRDELAARRAAPGAVDVAAHLAGLGADQAAAVTRLADPTRVLDALIGPAGSGKTRALAALVRAYVAAGRGVHLAAPTAVAAKGLAEAVGVEHHATLHALLGAWREGRDLPRAGDLVLVDEASMATSPMLAEAAERAIERGALLRLVGDPRQLRAVGAGGGLSLVADAAGAPELSELHRFAEAWEAEATLRLRRGDRDVAALYEARGRLRAITEAEALPSVVAAWWASPAGRDDTVMIASDNESVAALSGLARAARVAAGELDPAGVELSDGNVAGVGDLVTTRRNARTLPTTTRPGPGAYVRNHDRWRVEGIGEDGSLVVTHLERAERVVLPGDYVARDVELAYAETGHGTQGRTVARAEVLLRPGDTRSYAYVAMSRARTASVAHVVIDADGEAGSATAVLEAVLGHEDHVAASHWALEESAREEDPRLLAERLRVAGTEELRARLSTALGDRADLLTAPEGWRLLRRAAMFEERGGDAARALAGVGGGLEDHLGALRARPDREARDLLAGLFPVPGPQVDPGVAAYELSLGRRLEAWRAGIEARILTGELAVPETLGHPPADPAARAAWAYAVSVVALAQAVRPEGATDDPERVESLRAAWARTRARRLGGITPERRASVTRPTPSHSPVPRSGPRLGP